MENIDSDMFTFYDYIFYNHTSNSEKLVVTWDTLEEKYELLMKNEFNFNIANSRKNSYWVSELKRMVKWEPGNSITMVVYTYYYPKKVVISVINFKNNHIVNNPDMLSRALKIDEDGFLMVKNDYTNNEFERCNCIYNDELELYKYPYILK
jgi:hypothetical protein